MEEEFDCSTFPESFKEALKAKNLKNAAESGKITSSDIQAVYLELLKDKKYHDTLNKAIQLVIKKSYESNNNVNAIVGIVG